MVHHYLPRTLWGEHSVGRRNENDSPGRGGKELERMLKRVRIEVDDERSIGAVAEALNKYEQAIVALELDRFGLRPPEVTVNGSETRVVPDEAIRKWGGQGYPSSATVDLGRTVTSEVIEWDDACLGYKGRRVIQYRRLDSRGGAHRKDAEPRDAAGQVFRSVS